MAEARLWRVEFDRDAARDLRKRRCGTENSPLSAAAHSDRDNQRCFGRPLTGDLRGLWRYRVGDYRIVAAIEEHRFVVLVVTVGHSREVYE
jgi:mRNA interferase RelE/StbE